MLVKKFRSVVVSLSLLLIVGLQSMLVADDATPGRRLAVIVGVNTYRANQGLENLKQAVNDARELSRVLRDSGFKVIEMTQEAAKEPGKEHLAPNADFIRDQISGIVETPNLGRDDTILITLHGHGVQYDFVEVTKKDGKETTSVTPKLFFCPADASVLDSKGEKIQRANDLKERNHLLALDELYEQLGLCKSATKLLVVDACRNDPSSPLFRSADNEKLKSATMPKLPPPPGGIAAFFSCKANQRAIDDPDLKHGVFTHYLIQGLQGKADFPLDDKPADGVVTLSELTTYVANNTYGFVFDKYQGLRQSPEIKGEFDTNTAIVRIQRTLPKVIVSKTTGMKLVLIPDGEFEMGSRLTQKELASKFSKWHAKEDQINNEHPAHRVKISRPFYLGQHEVTVGQFRKFVTDTGFKTDAESNVDGGMGWDDSKSTFKIDPKYSWKNPGFYQTDDHPVVNLTWNDAKKFCDWLSRMDGQQYRLPTEAMWEYACRAGTNTLWSNGNDPEAVTRVGNISDGTLKGKAYFYNDDAVAAKDGYVFTAPVGKFTPNLFGLYDMHGNVHEWCEDVLDTKVYGQRAGTTVDPQQSEGGEYRVLRGGSWNGGPHFTRSASRGGSSPSDASNNIGFRISKIQ